MGDAVSGSPTRKRAMAAHYVRRGTQEFNHLTTVEPPHVSQAEAIAARMLEGKERTPHVPNPVTIRRFSWEKEQ